MKKHGIPMNHIAWQITKEGIATSDYILQGSLIPRATQQKVSREQASRASSVLAAAPQH